MYTMSGHVHGDLVRQTSNVLGSRVNYRWCKISCINRCACGTCASFPESLALGSWAHRAHWCQGRVGPCGPVGARWAWFWLLRAVLPAPRLPPRSFRVFPESLAHRARTLGPIGPGAVWVPLGPLGPLGLVLASVRSVARPLVLLKDEILHHLWVAQLPRKS